MSAASLLAAAALATATAAPQAPPPSPSEDETPVVEDETPADGGAATEADDEATNETETADEADIPPAPAMPLTPGSIPTEGETKAPPSQQALDRESPLAQPDTRPRDRAGRLGSPQRFAIEVKMGPFLPDVDRDYEGTGLGPYATIFGETNGAGEATGPPRAFPMPVVAFDWQFVYLAGPLGVGAQLGIFRDRADAIITAPTDPDNLRSSADTVTFTVLPLAILLSYRFELLADRFPRPAGPLRQGRPGLLAVLVQGRLGQPVPQQPRRGGNRRGARLAGQPRGHVSPGRHRARHGQEARQPHRNQPHVHLRRVSDQPGRQFRRRTGDQPRRQHLVCRAGDRILIPGLVPTRSARSIIDPSDHRPIGSSIDRVIDRSDHRSIWSSIDPVIDRSGHRSVRSLIDPPIHPSIHSLTHSLTHSLIHLPIHQFIGDCLSGVSRNRTVTP